MNWLTRTVLNFVIVGLAALPLLIYLKWVTPTQRGFFCNDPSLSYPYHSSTVPSWLLYLVGFGAPTISILICEFFGFSDAKAYAKSVINTIILFLFGAALSQLITDICKYTIGRLRPHFFDVCQPIFNATLCDPNAEEAAYIFDYTCPGNPKLFSPSEMESRLKEVHISFPSGHASFSFQAATFIVIYLHVMAKTNKWTSNNLIVPFHQILAICLAVFTSASRIMDNKHHPTDVLAGMIIGISAQVLNAFVSTYGNYGAKATDPSSVESEANELEPIRRDRGTTDYRTTSITA